jgi:WD40 repeat protein
VTAVEITSAPRSPFRGLSPFGDSELDALLFFGREREAEVIAANLMAAKLTVLYGPSGVGKTSVVRAGVATRLRSVARDNLRAYGEPGLAVVVVDGWSADAVDAVRRAADAAVAEALGEDVEVEAETLPERLAELGSLVGGELYLVLDQFEEFFLYHADEQGEGTFADVLPELVTRTDLAVSVLMAVRDDALAEIDAFKARIPGLFANSLRLDRLDRRSAREAVLGPIDAYNDLAPDDERVEAEPALVEAVLDQVAAGRIEHGRRGRGMSARASARRRVEAPYLQLVLQRVWDAEREAGSRTLRLATLEQLGGAERIVERHLEGALARLSSEQRDAAAAAFHHLVTPSGTKIAHAAPDLARYAGVPDATLRPALVALAASRVIRPLGGDAGGEPRFEIFHDVLSDAVLAWRERHETERALSRERADARRRHQRLVRVLSAAFAALALVAAVALYAVYQRDQAHQQAIVAQQQTALARLAAKDADAQRRRAEQKAAEALRQRTRAQALAKSEKRQKQKAERQTKVAVAARKEADRQTRIAEQKSEEALSQKSIAQAARADAEHQADVATDARAEAESSAAQAIASADQAERERKRATANAAAATRSERRARESEQRAVEAARHARGRERAARALALVPIDPEQALRRALEAARIEPTVRSEGVLRTALLAIRILAVLPGGGGPVRSLALSGDGRLLVTGSDRGGARIFDVASGRLLRVLGDETRTSSVAISPDNRLVATAGADERARVWSRETGTLLHTLPHAARVRTVAFSPDGLRLVSAGADATARVWDSATGLALQTLSHPLAVGSAEFSPDGRLVLTVGGDATAARVYDSGSGALLARLAHPGEVTDAAFSANSELVATSGRRNVRLWETAGWRMRHQLEGHSFTIRSVVFSPDSARVATAAADSTSRVWRTDTGVLLDVLTGHDAPVDVVAFSSDGESIATGSVDRRARVSSGPPGSPDLVLAGHDDTVSGIGFSPREEKVVTISSDGDARIWTTRTDVRLRLVGRHGGALAIVAYSPDGKLILSAGADGTARLWTSAGRAVRSLPHGAAIVRAEFSESGALVLTAGADGNARLWRTDSGHLVASFAHGAPIRAASLSGDALRIVTGGTDGTVRIWDVRGKRLVAEHATGGAVTAAAVSPDGKLAATGGSDGAVRLWRTRDGRPLRTFLGHSGEIASLAFSPNSLQLASAASGQDFTARLWDTPDGGVTPLEGHESGLTTIRYSRDGRFVVTAGVNGDVRTWRASDGIPRAILRGHVSVVADVAFSPDGRWIATAGPSAAGLWRASNGTRLFYLLGYASPLRTVAFAPSGGQVVTGGVDGTVRRYRCRLCGDIPELRALAKARLRALRLASEAARGGS